MKKKNTSIRQLAHAHDTFFKMAMSDKRVAQEFFEAHLPKEILNSLDLTQLELKSESYIDDLRKSSVADVLFKTALKDREAYLYLVVDHQSKPDKLMPFRILKYTCNIIDQHLKESGNGHIPFILPFVLYHGKKPWHYSTDIRDLVEGPKDLVERYFLKPFFLVDLNQIEDSVLKEKVWLGIMELTLKHIFDQNIEPALKDIIDLLKVVMSLGDQQFTEAALVYIIDRGQISDKIAFLQQVKTDLSEEVGGKMATIAQQFWADGLAEGKQEGRQEGVREVAERLLNEGAELAFVAKVTGLTLISIQEIEKELLK